MVATFKKNLKSLITKTYGIIPHKKKGLRVLMYHSIEDKVELDPTGLFTVSKDNFLAQMNFLLKNKSSFLHFNEAAPSDQLSYAITFDDGYKSNMKYAFNFLEENRIPYTVFVSPWYVETNHPDFLSKDDIKQLASSKYCQLAAHGYKHVNLASLAKDDLEIELKKSKSSLEAMSGKEINSMAYPYGRYNSLVLKVSKQIGFKYSGNSVNNIKSKKTKPLEIPRTEINCTDDISSFTKKCMGDYDWLKLKKYVGR